MRHLFVLPFDHRSTFVKQLLGFPYPCTNAIQQKRVQELKQLIFKAFLQARKQTSTPGTLAILADEEFGAPILERAKKTRIPFAVSVEKSGQEIFDFEYGARFGAHLVKLRPTWAKALVRYDFAQRSDNKIQRTRLKKLSQFCSKNKIPIMLEILLTGKGALRKQALRMFQEMQGEGIVPNLWKLEGLSKVRDWKILAQHTSAPMIVLGRGESRLQVACWIKAAAQSRVVSGFAIGRTIWFKPLQQFMHKKISRPTAIQKITNNFLRFIKLWHKLNSSPNS